MSFIFCLLARSVRHKCDRSALDSDERFKNRSESSDVWISELANEASSESREQVHHVNNRGDRRIVTSKPLVWEDASKALFLPDAAVFTNSDIRRVAKSREVPADRPHRLPIPYESFSVPARIPCPLTKQK